MITGVSFLKKTGTETVYQEKGETLKIKNGEWYYFVDGKQNTKKYGFIDYAGGKFFVHNGKVDVEANGLVQDPENLQIQYYVSAGQVQTQYTGLVLNDGNWYYILNGVFQNDYTGDVVYQETTFSVVDGKMPANETN